jgi:hypothetical protein
VNFRLALVATGCIQLTRHHNKNLYGKALTLTLDSGNRMGLTRNCHSASGVTLSGNSLMGLTRNCHSASGMTLSGNSLMGLTRNCHSASGVTLSGNSLMGLTRNCHSASGVTLAGINLWALTRNCHGATGVIVSANSLLHAPCIEPSASPIPPYQVTIKCASQIHAANQAASIANFTAQASARLAARKVMSDFHNGGLDVYRR